MYKLKTCKSNRVQFSMSQIMVHTVLRQKSETDCFHHVELVSSDDNEKCVAVVDPIIMLFNQERLNKLGADTVEAWLKSMESSSNSAVNRLRSQCSDDDLTYMIKSRHLQAPCEISAWIDYMGSHLDKFKELYAAEVADAQAKKSAELHVEQKTE